MEPDDREEIEHELGLTFGFGQDDWRERITSLDSDQLGELKQSIHLKGIEMELDTGSDAPKALSALSSLLDGFRFLMLTPEAWNMQRGELLVESSQGSTLFVFDKNLGEFGDGAELIKATIAAGSGGSKFCILTATVSKNAEFDDWAELCEANGWTLDQVGLVSKQHLSDDLLDFARMLKMSLTTGPVLQVRSLATNAYLEAAKVATELIDKVNVPVLVQMVFQSSHVEGVSEVDTLLRLLEAHSTDAIDSVIHGNTDLYEAVKAVRDAALVDTGGPDPRLADEASKVAAVERYATAETLNQSNRALACGDIFRDGAGRLWILCEQPCDILIRRNGTRNAALNAMRVVPIVRQGKRPKTPHVNLQNFPLDKTEGNDRAYALVARPGLIPADVVDLCCFRSDGKAIAARDDEVPVLATAGLEKRRERLWESFAGILADVDPKDPTSEGLARAMLPRSDHPAILAKVELDQDNWRLSYAIERVGRLRERHAETVLTTFGLAVSRTAEAHDLARISDELEK
jgi:hypothetical protein